MGSEFRSSIAASAAKDLTNLHHGHSITFPTLASASHAVRAQLNTEYLLWWSALNFGTETTRKTTIIHRGPGADTRESMQVFYGTNSFTLTWILGVEHTRSGVFKSSVKIVGAANSKSRGGCFAQ